MIPIVVLHTTSFLLEHAIVPVCLDDMLHLSHCKHRQWYDDRE